MSLLFNMADLYNQLVRRDMCSDWHGPYTVFFASFAPYSKSVEVYFTSEHSFTDLHYATACSVFTYRQNLLNVKCDMKYLCK